MASSVIPILGALWMAGAAVPAPIPAPDAPERIAAIVANAGRHMAPAIAYANMASQTCLEELHRRGASFEMAGEAHGVTTPIRLTGPLNGVRYASTLPEKQRAKSKWEILDCRLALALFDFSNILREYNIVEVVHYSMYRPARPGQRDHLGRRHYGALAIDAAKFIRSDGSILDVERDFGGYIGATTCGPNATPARSTAGVILRNIVCGASQARLFNVELTPDYNRPHRNHFHLEVTPHVSWFLVH